MILLATIFAVTSAALAAKAAMLTRGLRAARAELAESRRPVAPAAPPPPVTASRFECRFERRGLLWFPSLTASDDGKLVVGASSGLPHCLRCVKPLKLVPGRVETWTCAGCGESHPGTEADLLATDEVLTDCLREFFARHPDYAPAPGLSAPKYEHAVA
jgi:hypothetical protein